MRAPGRLRSSGTGSAGGGQVVEAGVSNTASCCSGLCIPAGTTQPSRAVRQPFSPPWERRHKGKPVGVAGGDRIERLADALALLRAQFRLHGRQQARRIQCFQWRPRRRCQLGCLWPDGGSCCGAAPPWSSRRAGRDRPQHQPWRRWRCGEGTVSPSASVARCFVIGRGAALSNGTSASLLCIELAGGPEGTAGPCDPSVSQRRLGQQLHRGHRENWPPRPPLQFRRAGSPGSTSATKAQAPLPGAFSARVTFRYAPK